jgi:hypothetical protein
LSIGVQKDASSTMARQGTARAEPSPAVLLNITPEALTLQGIDQETPKHLDGHRGHDARCSPASRG